ncbi:MAG: hypothetical protein ABEJ94_07780 [Halorientalis sp.]
MSDTISEQRVVAVLVGVIAALVGIGMTGTSLVAFFIGGFEPVLRASGTTLGLFSLFLSLVGVCMLVGAAGLWLDTAWDWSVTTIAFTVTLLLSAQSLVANGLSPLPVLLTLLNLLVVAVCFQRASFDQFPTPSPS